MSSRIENNRKIVNLLREMIEVVPEQRFGQIICNYVFPNYRERDPFFEESEATLERLKELKKKG